MLFGKSLATILLLLPVLEIATFVIVAAQIGVLRAFGLLLLAGLAGGVLLRQAGRSQMNRLRAALAEGTGRLEIKDLGLVYLLAGVLLLIPGFLTDILALLLLIPPVRRALAAAIGHAIMPRPTPSRPTVVDLDQQEWHRVPEAGLPPPDRAEPPEHGPGHQDYRERP